MKENTEEFMGFTIKGTKKDITFAKKIIKQTNHLKLDINWFDKDKCEEFMQTCMKYKMNDDRWTTLFSIFSAYRDDYDEFSCQSNAGDIYLDIICGWYHYYKDCVDQCKLANKLLDTLGYELINGFFIKFPSTNDKQISRDIVDAFYADNFARLIDNGWIKKIKESK